MAYKLSNSNATGTYSHQVTFLIDKDADAAVLSHFVHDHYGIMDFMNGKQEKMNVQEAREQYKQLLNKGYSR